MSSSPAPERWIARAQPWLGTLVEIALPQGEATQARFDAAFAAIAHVHRKMSPEESGSDLTRIRREAHLRAVMVDPTTVEVLEASIALHLESEGLFDPAAFGHGATSIAALRLGPKGTVCSSAPLALDLGGIAKGYAVDRAVTALRTSGARAGRVNAGGDLRVFGRGAWTRIRLRHPQRLQQSAAEIRLKEAAIATSADCFNGAALVDPRSGSARPFGAGISVVAPSCMLADALTKVVALAPERAPSILAAHRATAFVIDAAAGALRHTDFSAAAAKLRLAA
jgi:thiamine biosynthesis lipoprotein